MLSIMTAFIEKLLKKTKNVFYFLTQAANKLCFVLRIRLDKLRGNKDVPLVFPFPCLLQLSVDGENI